MKALIGILFGKEPKIFNSAGEVEHKHPKKKWDDWMNRYTSLPEFNWKNHKGTQAKSVKKD